MNIRDLPDRWQRFSPENRSRKTFEIDLPHAEAAKVAAIAEMFDVSSEQSIISDLVSAALSELEESLPYKRGSNIVSQDEDGNPIYEDVGPTPEFIRLTKEKLAKLQTAN